ncbi:MAG: ABC transporter ATP-binding protein [Deltaproteobacteria bacterium]|nr:ABC transporter ATP-binding protein [Deltaproteobacteria bacterium]MCB9786332.1 ABC transporter ATP-binding protein [Deltaproteobacteria bacterium]
MVARGLRRHFGAIAAVDGIDLDVPPGSVVGLLGPNGAGKTTAMRILATLLVPQAGTATVAGVDVVADPLGVRRRLGYLTGDTGLYGRLTPREILRYIGRLHGMSGQALAARIEHLSHAMGLDAFVDRRAETLSTGQKQRVSIARAVLHDPPVLILDEPTSGLDILAASEVLRFFRDEADRGKAVILSTHILAEVELICDRAAIIHHGRIRAEGSLEELREASGADTLARGFFTLLGEAPAGGAPT